MRGSLLLCLAGAATSFVREPRRLVLQAMPPRVAYKQQVKNLLARGNDSGYTLPGEDTPLTPERFAAEILKLPGCRAWEHGDKILGVPFAMDVSYPPPPLW